MQSVDAYLVPALSLLSGLAGLLLLRSSFRRKPDAPRITPIEESAQRTTNFTRVTKIY